MPWSDIVAVLVKGPRGIPAIVGFVLWAGLELWRGTFSTFTLVDWKMFPPEAAVRLVLFVGSAILAGAAVQYWNQKRRTKLQEDEAKLQEDAARLRAEAVKKENLRVRVLNNAIYCRERWNFNRLTLLEDQLFNLGIKGNVSYEELPELIRYLRRYDIEGAAKRFSPKE